MGMLLLSVVILSINVSTVFLSSSDLDEVLTTIRDASHKWYHLGIELGIAKKELESIIQIHYQSTEACFTKMLSAWLDSLHPSWEKLLVALEQPKVGYMYSELTEEIRLKLHAPAGLLHLLYCPNIRLWA